MAEKVERPALKYFGSKWRMFPWISSFFPTHVCYIEAFCGGASTLLQKYPAKIEVMNDLNQRVVNFFKVIRERPDEFIRWIEMTPWSRAEQLLSYEVSEEPMEDARRFYVQAWQSFGGAPATKKTGWRIDKTGLRSNSNLVDWNNIVHLWAITRRLKNVHIECDDAFKLIKRWDGPENLFYLDPPYVESTLSRRAKGVYPYTLTDEGQAEFLEILRDVKGYVVLSGYPSDIYQNILPDWRHETRSFVGDFDTNHTESLWLNPKCAAAVKQMDIFAGVQNESEIESGQRVLGPDPESNKKRNVKVVGKPTTAHRRGGRK